MATALLTTWGWLPRVTCFLHQLSDRAQLSAPQLRVYYNEWEAVLAYVNAVTSPTVLGTAYQVSGLVVGKSNPASS